MKIPSPIYIHTHPCTQAMRTIPNVWNAVLMRAVCASLKYMHTWKARAHRCLSNKVRFAQHGTQVLTFWKSHIEYIQQIKMLMMQRLVLKSWTPKWRVLCLNEHEHSFRNRQRLSLHKVLQHSDKNPPVAGLAGNCGIPFERYLHEQSVVRRRLNQCWYGWWTLLEVCLGSLFLSVQYVLLAKSLSHIITGSMSTVAGHWSHPHPTHN